MSPVLTAHYCHSSTVWAKNIVHVDLSTSTFFFFFSIFSSPCYNVIGFMTQVETGTACVCQAKVAILILK